VRVFAIRYRRNTLLLALCFGVLVGLCCGRQLPVLQPAWFWVVIAVFCTAIGRYRFLGLCGLLLFGFMSGSMRGSDIAAQLTGYSVLYDQKVLLQVTANEDAVYGKNGQLTFVGVAIVDVASGTELPGKVGVSGFGENAIYQDDVVLVEAKLREGIGAYQGFMSYGVLDLVERNPSLLLDIRRRFGAGMLGALPEPLASFSMAILIGQRSSLPEDVEDHLKMVGLTHIVAVSGANLTIMLEASRKLLGRSSKRFAVAVSIGLMLAFVLMTGGSASIIRAGFVSGLSVAAAYYGHRARPLLIISLVAAITALINPIYIWSDASWYLSFLAFFGVLMVSPLLQNRLPGIFQRNILLAIVLESICAEIMSLPYILYTFGEMSCIGLVANMLVVAMIPLSMLFGFIAGLAGTFLPSFVGWFAWPAKLLLMYMLEMAHVLADLPGVFKEGVSIDLTGVVLCYCVIVIMVALLSFKDRAKSVTITDEEAINPYKNLGRMS
jgi:competence protein ComEC